MSKITFIPGWIYATANGNKDAYFIYLCPHMKYHLCGVVFIHSDREVVDMIVDVEDIGNAVCPAPLSTYLQLLHDTDRRRHMAKMRSLKVRINESIDIAAGSTS